MTSVHAYCPEYVLDVFQLNMLTCVTLIWKLFCFKAVASLPEVVWPGSGHGCSQEVGMVVPRKWAWLFPGSGRGCSQEVGVV